MAEIYHRLSRAIILLPGRFSLNIRSYNFPLSTSNPRRFHVVPIRKPFSVYEQIGQRYNNFGHISMVTTRYPSYDRESIN